SDSEAHDVLLCIQTGKTIEDKDRMKFQTDQFYFKSPEEMLRDFAYCREAVENTLAIAERCNVTIELNKQFLLPHYRKIEKGSSPDELLKQMADSGLAKLMPSIAKGNRDVQKRYEDRMQYELSVIKSMGFSSYFLIVADFIQHARDKKIPVGPGRGSAVGSLAAYAVGITNVDPIRYNLFFERFLNPDRISMPDIDIDFCMEGRDEVIRYVTEEYGSDHVAQIITFGKMQAKAVVRDVGRALNISYGEVDRIAKMIPNDPKITLDEAIKREPRLKEEEKNSERIRKLLALSRSLEGLNRHASTHAAGVVISDKPLVERVPLFKGSNNDIVTQYPMNDIQAVGLTKFDFLGLKTLTVINQTLRFIREGRGEDINIDALPLDDELTYQLLGKGQTDGVFQLESSGMKDLLVKAKPDCIEDVIACISIYRPGPMNQLDEYVARKQGRKKVIYNPPQLEEILKETYGIILYQEQVMQIVSVLADYTMADADNLRKMISKKKPEDMEKESPKFLEGAKKHRIPKEVAAKLWDDMKSFGGYGFNKSHGTAYAMISFQTAYLKSHYPVEFMASLLTCEKNNRDNIIKYLSSCRDMGIQVLPPDMNESQSDFGVSAGRIRFGLAAVKNVGVAAVESIIESRVKSGRFTTFYDFCSRADLRKINKKVLESLIKSGAFDSLEKNRARLMQGIEQIIDIAQRKSRERLNGQKSLFDDSSMADDASAMIELPDTPEWDHDTLISHEKEMIGFYITGHPLLKYNDKLSMISDTTSETLARRSNGDPVTVAGVVNSLKEATTKKKEAMAYITLDDMKGFMTVIVFPDLYRGHIIAINGNEPLCIRGKVDAGDDEEPKIIATEILTIEEALQQSIIATHVKIDSRSTTDNEIDNLKALLQTHKGNSPVYLHLVDNNSSEIIIQLGDDHFVAISEDLRTDLNNLLGKGSSWFK
ncbi:MAG: DNA polymerase III subunit alpha, partial [Deltaproteobacteria bacterium]|nr:DNA polymerase III subunit alpha [Deltaproteobacteria bacterium]